MMDSKEPQTASGKPEALLGMEIISRAEANKRGLKHYFTGKPCKRGHVRKRLTSSYTCVECSRLSSLARYPAIKDDPEYRRKKRARNRRWYINNREKAIERQKEWYQKNPEKVQDWYKKHGRTERLRKYQRRYLRQRQRTDPEYRIRKALRTRLRLALKNNQKTGSAVRDLGCTIPELKAHLEAQFQEGMCWENYGYYGWHMDHVIPLASFDLTDRAQLKKACHYSNLQPLWAADNFAKSAKEVTP